MTVAEYLILYEMSDAEFARRIGVPRSAVGRWKRGHPARGVNVSKISKGTGGIISADEAANPTTNGKRRTRAA